MEFRYEVNGVPKELFNLGEGLAVVAGAIALTIALVVLAIAAATYVLRSVGLYTMAKNRGIENAWLAWVPVGSSWVLGQIADDVNYRQGKTTNYSLILLVLTAVTAAGGLSLGLLPFGALLSAPLSIGASVVGFIALYDIYQDYAPKYAVVYLVLSILLSVSWLLLFLLRDSRPAAQAPARQAVPPASVYGWNPNPAPKAERPPKECPPEHWGGIARIEPTQDQDDK